MIVLKAAQDNVLAALQVVSGIVQRRHTLPILANILRRGRDLSKNYDDYVAMRRDRMTPVQLLQILAPLLPEPVRLPVKLASQGCLELARRRARKLRGFFGASKVNARNAP